MNYVRGILGNKQPEPPRPPEITEPSGFSHTTSSPHHQPPPPQQAESPRNVSRASSFCSGRRIFLWRLVNHRVWKAITICFTIILLFGSQVRDLFVPANGDAVVDGVFLVVFGFFWIDIILRMDCEVNYFHLYLWWMKNGYSSGGGTRPHEQDARPFFVGSFLFWCDVVSTLCLLREISLLDWEGKFDVAEITVGLDQSGLPFHLGGRGHVNEASPLEYNAWDLLAIIGKSARVARFVRSSNAVRLASRINWFFLFERYHKRRQTNKQKAQILNKRASWTDVLLREQLKRRMPYSRPQTGRGVSGLFLSACRAMGLLKDQKNELARQMAAIKIQRAWRKFKGGGFDDDEDGGADEEHAWKGRGHAATPMDRVLKKRSILQQSITSSPSSPNHLVRDPSGLNNGSIRRESQVGSAMRELTGQRVALGIFVALLITVLLTYQEISMATATTMIVLHSQTTVKDGMYAAKSLDAARRSTAKDMYKYVLASQEELFFDIKNGQVDPNDLRDREILRVIVKDYNNLETQGFFSQRENVREDAVVSLLTTVFILIIWFFGVTSFAGPVMILVVIPIERMVRLLTMLMLDPLGYQSTARYRRFVAEEDEITKNTRWTKDVLKGMETSFLMSTILRIGSLMKVGFGSAGVEIIRGNLERGQSKNTVMLANRGSTVSCIFLFCDIRQFTDATECLQEEVFVFTNRIAAVVHSYCHAYGGSANKNIGDAFLLSWILDEEAPTMGSGSFGRPKEAFAAKRDQADKALFTVVQILIALQYDDYYVETMSKVPRDALLAKISQRKKKGPIVQMGFGLHAGTAVQGAIGSTRKIDATYVSEAVERAEFLESSTKKYGLKMLMSDSFHRLLNPNQRRRCRKVDQIIIRNDDDAEDDDDGEPEGEVIELFTFDLDLDAKDSKATPRQKSDGDSDIGSEKGIKATPLSRRQVSAGLRIGRRRGSITMRMPVPKDNSVNEEPSEGGFNLDGTSQADPAEKVETKPKKELHLPTGRLPFNQGVWTKQDIKDMRRRFLEDLFFLNFNNGLQAFYSKDWDRAKQCFSSILEGYEDGPSRYFFEQIKKHNGKPPRNFLPYGVE